MEIKKTWKIEKKYFDKIVNGTKEFEFRLNKPEYKINRGDIVAFECQGETIYCKVEETFTQSNNFADAVYGAYLWGNQMIDDNDFENAIETYQDLKKYYSKEDVQKYGCLVMSISYLKEYEGSE